MALLAALPNGDRQNNLGKKKDGGVRTWRFDLALEDPTDEKTNEFSYIHLVNDAIKKRDTPPLEDDGPVDSKLLKIAKELEEKYGSAVKKRRIVHDADYADLGYGYDTSDSFVDDADAVDDFVPPGMDTEFGGFYINTGDLEFKRSKDTEIDDLELAKAKKKPKISRQPTHGTPQTAWATKKLKLAKQQVASAKKLKHPVLMRKTSSDSSKGPATPILKGEKKRRPKAEKEGVKRSQQQPQKSLLAQFESVTPGNNVQSCASAEGSLPIQGDQSAEGLNQPLLQPTASQLLEDVGGSVDVFDSLTAVGGDAGAKQGGVVKGPPPPLPDGIPADLAKMIEDLASAVIRETSGDKKMTQKTRMGFDAQLMEVEKVASRFINNRIKMGIYEHLAAVFGVSRNSLTSRTRKFMKKREEDKMATAMDKLKQAVDERMKVQLKKYEEDVAAAASVGAGTGDVVAPSVGIGSGGSESDAMDTDLAEKTVSSSTVLSGGDESQGGSGPQAQGGGSGPLAPGGGSGPQAPGGGSGPLAPGGGSGPQAPGGGSGPLAPGGGSGPLAPGGGSGPQAPGGGSGPQAPGSGSGPLAPGGGNSPQAPASGSGPLAPGGKAGQQAQPKAKKVRKKHFKWDAEVKQLLINVVTVKLEKEQVQQRSLNVESMLMQFLDESVKPLWPKGWMFKGILMRVSEPAYKHLLPPKEAGVKPIAQLQPSTPAATAPPQPSGSVGSITAPATTAPLPPSGSSSSSSPITIAKLPQAIVQVPKVTVQAQLPATTPTPTAVVKDTVSVVQPPVVAPDILGLLKPPVNSPIVERSSPPKEQKDTRKQQTPVIASSSPAPAKDAILTVLPEGIKMVLPPTIPWAKLVTHTTVASTSHAETKVTASATPHQATPHSVTTTPDEQGGGASVQQVGGASVQQVGGASVKQVGGASVQQVGRAPVRQVGGASVQHLRGVQVQQVGGALLQQVGGVTTQEVGRKPTQPMGQTGSTAAAQARKVHAKPLPITGGAPIRGTATQRQNMTPTQQVGMLSAQQVGVPSPQQVGVSSPQVGVSSVQQVAAAQELPSKSSAQLDLILKKIVKMKAAFSPSSSDPIVLLSQTRPSPTTALQAMPGTQPSSCSTLHTVAGTVESVSMATTVPRSPIATQIMAEHSYQDSSTTLASTAMAGDVTVGAVAMATPTIIRQTTNLAQYHPPDSNNPSL